MKKDLEIPKVENISVAVVKEMNDEKTAEVFNVYLLNMRDAGIENVLVSSKGYGTINGEKKTTSTLRRFYEKIESQSYQLIEPISKEVFPLSNEYFVTFYIDKVIYDKKIIFVPEAIKEDHFTKVHLLDKQGVLIK